MAVTFPFTLLIRFKAEVTLYLYTKTQNKTKTNRNFIMVQIIKPFSNGFKVRFCISNDIYFKVQFFKTKCIAGFAHIKKVTYLITVKDV